jgi:hypothetical protein
MKRGALPRLAVQGDISAQAPGKNQGSRQTQSVSFARHDGTLLDLGVALEYHFLVFGFNPLSVIANRHNQIIVFNIHLDFDLSASMMERIFKKIAGDLAKFDLILEDLGILHPGRKFQRDAILG